MNSLLIALFVIALPIASFVLIRFADDLLTSRIQAANADLTRVRTDLFLLRGAFASQAVGLAILVLWALGLVVLAIIAEIGTATPHVLIQG